LSENAIISRGKANRAATQMPTMLVAVSPASSAA
jgi:hypothetical protein